ncbi:hypothetical protein CEXT_707341 [Caerostris extrusa]|uniref:Uncharacterized protein n=1 Tax=Caerostris extrusa TaxID=172846 RepID=A0AAV4R6E9_CAEEX|nr:hypothetical protein CEXT_707341 [Caerostris extrusa]
MPEFVDSSGQEPIAQHPLTTCFQLITDQENVLGQNNSRTCSMSRKVRTLRTTWMCIIMLKHSSVRSSKTEQNHVPYESST